MVLEGDKDHPNHRQQRQSYSVEHTDQRRGSQGAVSAVQVAKGGEEDGKKTSESSFLRGWFANIVFRPEPEDERGQTHQDARHAKGPAVACQARLLEVPEQT